MFLEYLEFILYGLIQGLTEFIPVSSTAHLKVIPIFFGIEDPGPSLSAIFQLGSVLALVWYFRNEIFKLRSKSSKTKIDNLLNKKLLRSILIGTIPIIFLGGTIKLYLPYFFGEENILAKSIAGFFSIIGHVFPIFFKFKGGKGVGTALGTLLAFPQLHLATLIGFLSWLSSLLITGYVGKDLVINEFVYDSFTLVVLGCFGIAGLEKFAARNKDK